MTKTGVEEEGLAVCEMMEKVEGVEEGKMEKKAEEKVAEAELGVLPGMSGSCLSQEAEPQSPTMDEHKPRPDGSTAEGHIKVTDRIAGQKKVFRKRQKAKPKMQTAEAAGTEGGPRNTRAPFRLQDFMCFKISKHCMLSELFSCIFMHLFHSWGNIAQEVRAVVWQSEGCRFDPAPWACRSVPEQDTSPLIAPNELISTLHGSLSPLVYTVLLLLVLLAFPVNSNETPKQRMCALCLDKDCATGVRIIYPAGSDTPVWLKANSPTGIQTCSMENLKPDAPCKMANGSLVQLANKMLHFEGIDTYDVRRIFYSQILPCADLNLLSKPSPVTKTPIHNTPTPAAPNISVVDNKDSGSGIGGGIGGGIGIFFGIVIVIVILIGVLIWKCKSCGQGQDKDYRHGNNKVPPHDAEDCDENTMWKQPLKGEVPNENVNRVHREDGSVGPEGYLDDSPV